MAKPKLKRSAQPALELVTPELPHQRFTPPPPLRPQTESQRLLLSSLRANTLTLVKGSAGTGKTYVPLAYAADLLRAHEIERIILTRPLVGVEDEDDKIGALPGELEQKMMFWAMPMMDVLEERLGRSQVQALVRGDRIRVAPMAFLRGASLNEAFVHCTEAQNSTPKQLKMLLTRVGEGAKICVDGDTSQSDLPGANGLEDVIRRASGKHGVGLVEFGRADVVRSDFCQQVLDWYDE